MEEIEDLRVDSRGRAYTRALKPPPVNIVPTPTPGGDADGRRPVGVEIDHRIVRGFPTPSGKLEFYSSTLAKWGWAEYALPGYIKSQVHPENLEEGEIPLIPTFRLPVQIHTRSANSKWLDEIAHTNPLWIHPRDAARIGVRTGELVRVETLASHGYQGMVLHEGRLASTVVPGFWIEADWLWRPKLPSTLACLRAILPDRAWPQAHGGACGRYGGGFSAGAESRSRT